MSDNRVLLRERPQQDRLGWWLLFGAILIGAIGAFYLGWHKNQTSVLISVPVRDLPAYSQIEVGDLEQQSYSKSALNPDILREAPNQLEGHYILVDAPKQRPLLREQLVESDRIKDTVAIAIPATPNLTLGGSLKAGDSVDILITPKMEKEKPPTRAVLFSNILVLSVKLDQPSGAVVIALPLSRREEFIQASASATLWLTRKF